MSAITRDNPSMPTKQTDLPGTSLAHPTTAFAMGTLNLEQHQLSVGDVPHNPPPSSLHEDRRENFRKCESGVSAAIESASPS